MGGGKDHSNFCFKKGQGDGTSRWKQRDELGSYCRVQKTRNDLDQGITVLHCGRWLHFYCILKVQFFTELDTESKRRKRGRIASFGGSEQLEG